MENHQILQERKNPSPPATSPTASTTSSSSSSSNSNGVGAAAAAAAAKPAAAAPPPPLTPKSIPRSVEVNPYPTTFIQADTSSFKQVVQMLTGSAETAAKRAAAASPGQPPAKNPIPISPAAKATGPKKPAFKLYERRSGLKNLKMISPLMPTFRNSNSNPNSPAAAAFSPRKQPEILSPSVLDFPSLVLSPVTPLIPDPFNRSPQQPSSAPYPSPAMSAEDRAIAEKGFFLHPSPRTPEPPRLLPLFPVTSPRVSSSP